MRVHDLRLILLIQAIEESDTKGELLPLAEREEATQEMVRGAGDVDEAFAGDALSPTGERLLTRRAQHLHERVRLRALITDRLLAVIVGAARRDGLWVLALLSDVVLAALDGVPRLFAAAAASLRLWWIARRMAVPASVVLYARRTLLATDVVSDGNQLYSP